MNFMDILSNSDLMIPSYDKKTKNKTIRNEESNDLFQCERK